MNSRDGNETPENDDFLKVGTEQSEANHDDIKDEIEIDDQDNDIEILPCNPSI